MTRIILIVLLLLALAAAPVAAQDCGNGLPCGPVPWRLPQLPALSSPTPMPTLSVVDPNPNPGGEPTNTPTPYPTSQIDQQGISDQMATIQALVEATEQVVYAEGTPVNTQDQFDLLAADATQFFGYALAVSDEPFGKMSPLVMFGVTALGTVMAVKVLTFLMPFLGVLFGLIRKVVQVILDFIPL